ncbi:Cortactin-binding protein 2 [Bienertia sinuspersici]
MKNYTPPEDGSGPKDPYLGVMDKEYTGRRRLYGRGVTNKVPHKVASSSVNYVVPDEVLDALRADIQNEKTETVDMRKELEVEYKRKKVELKANYAKKIEEFDKTKDKMVQDVFKKLISKLPTNVGKSLEKALNPTQLLHLSATGKPLKVFLGDIPVSTSIESLTSSTR